jgi:hypothetical protein
MSVTTITWDDDDANMDGLRRLMLTYAIEHRMYEVAHEILGYNDDTDDTLLYSVDITSYFSYLKYAFEHDDSTLLAYVFHNVPCDENLSYTQATELRQIWMDNIEKKKKYDILKAATDDIADITVDPDDENDDEDDEEKDDDDDMALCLMDYIIVSVYSIISENDADAIVCSDLKRIKEVSGIDITELCPS